MMKKTYCDGIVSKHTLSVLFIQKQEQILTVLMKGKEA